MSETFQRYTLAIVAHLALLLAWYLFVTLGNVPKFVMPPSLINAAIAALRRLMLAIAALSSAKF